MLQAGARHWLRAGWQYLLEPAARVLSKVWGLGCFLRRRFPFWDGSGSFGFLGLGFRVYREFIGCRGLGVQGVYRTSGLRRFGFLGSSSRGLWLGFRVWGNPTITLNPQP